MSRGERGGKTKRATANKKAQRTSVERDKLPRKYRKLASHPFPEAAEDEQIPRIAFAVIVRQQGNRVWLSKQNQEKA